MTTEFGGRLGTFCNSMPCHNYRPIPKNFTVSLVSNFILEQKSRRFTHSTEFQSKKRRIAMMVLIIPTLRPCTLHSPRRPETCRRSTVLLIDDNNCCMILSFVPFEAWIAHFLTSAPTHLLLLLPSSSRSFLSSVRKPLEHSIRRLGRWLLYASTAPNFKKIMNARWG